MKITLPVAGGKGHGRSGWFTVDQILLDTSTTGLVGDERGTVRLQVVSRKVGETAPIILQLPPSMARKLGHKLIAVASSRRSFTKRAEDK